MSTPAPARPEPHPRPDSRTGARPHLSVVPVHDEQDDLERCVRRLHEHLSAALPEPRVLGLPRGMLGQVSAFAVVGALSTLAHVLLFAALHAPLGAQVAGLVALALALALTSSSLLALHAVVASPSRGLGLGVLVLPEAIDDGDQVSVHEGQQLGIPDVSGHDPREPTRAPEESPAVPNVAVLRHHHPSRTVGEAADHASGVLSAW